MATKLLNVEDVERAREGSSLAEQMTIMKNSFEYMLAEVTRMETEIQSNRKLLSKKDEQIRQQDCKIEQLNRTINDI